MIDVINLIERLTGKKASQYDVDWVETLLERDPSTAAEWVWSWCSLDSAHGVKT